MRLGDCLLQTDILLLRDIASNYQLECSRFSKNDLISTILQTFRRRSFVSDAYRQVSEEAVRDVWVQLALYPRNELSAEDVDVITKRAAARFPVKKPILSKLMQQGWIYRVGSRESLYKYIIPDEIRLQMRQTLTETVKSQVELSSEDPVIWREEAGSILRDISTFLQRAVSPGLKLTVDGTIFKKQFEKLMELSELQEEPLSGTGWRFGYGRRFHQYPDRFAFIYDYCYLRALIQEDLEAGVLRITQEGKEWAQQSLVDRKADLLNSYALLYRRPIPRLSLIIASIQTVCEGNWVTVDSLKKVIQPYLASYYFDTEDILFERRIIGMLVHLGLLQYGSLSTGVHVVRMNDSSVVPASWAQAEPDTQKETEPVLFIQPNFEVLVPKECVDVYCKDLEDMADLRSVDMMRVYRINKTTTQRAIRVGWTDSSLFEFLDRASGGLMPVNVRRMMQTWMEEYGKVTLYKAAVMECRTPEVADEVVQLPGIKSEVWGRIGDRHLLIREEAFENVAKTLEQMGYSPDLW
ncbi:MAG: hypothetical protein JWN30_1557 [Bacilli bacterium]|nr:hypothetical protein [Bacilli bacterium]